MIAFPVIYASCSRLVSPLHTLVHLDLRIAIGSTHSTRCPSLHNRNHTKHKRSHPRKPRNGAERRASASYITDLEATVSHHPPLLIHSPFSLALQRLCICSPILPGKTEIIHTIPKQILPLKNTPSDTKPVSQNSIVMPSTASKPHLTMV